MDLINLLLEGDLTVDAADGADWINLYYNL